MEERIRTVRKHFKLTQTAFADRIGLKGNTVTSYEKGLRTPNNAVIMSICKEFNVSEEWLRAGEGEPFIPIDPHTKVERVVAMYNSSETLRAILNAYVDLNDAQRDAVRQFIEKTAEGLQGNSERLSGIGKEIEADIDKDEADLLGRNAD